MDIDIENESVRLGLFAGGVPADVYYSDFPEFPSDARVWNFAGRFAGIPSTFSWEDACLPRTGGRVYVAADATHDSDGDGLPDAMEGLLYGTSPYLRDTDGDGATDLQELAWGRDPLVADFLGVSRLFFDGFESPLAAPGSLDGQNGWIASNGAEVSSESPCEGDAALEMTDAVAMHEVESGVAKLWIDMHVKPGEAGWTDGVALPVSFTFDAEMHPVMSDGATLVTNRTISLSAWNRWARCTVFLDGEAGVWDFYLDGILAGRSLSTGSDTGPLRSIEIEGCGFVDGVEVSAVRPGGLSSDGDRLPDEWEMACFGDLLHDGTEDSDGDGISDLDEYRSGTDPLSPDSDTDLDGLPDWWEIANGLDPFSAGFPANVFFRETFGPPGVQPGDIDGQNGWTASAAGDGIVRARSDSPADPALSIRSHSGREASVARSIASSDGLVWLDMWMSNAVGSACDDAGDSIVAFFFDASGHPVLSDGDGFATNLSVRVEDESGWTRCTCKLDFNRGAWDFYLNGEMAAEGLSLRGGKRIAGSIEFGGLEGDVDNIYIGGSRPQGLSSDGDGIPDEWEWRNFGLLDRNGKGDFDRDGLSDAEESRLGTNPCNADTDGDGLSDADETAIGTDPLDGSDARSDPDGDGLSTIEEFRLGTDPFNPDTDGDGMPDGREAANATDPLASDALADPDGDGLANIEELRHGTNPLSADTDGDGVPDFEETFMYLSDPLAADFDGTVETNSLVDASSAGFAAGEWTADGCSAVLAGRAGGLFFTNAIYIASSGARQLRVPVVYCGPCDMELVCSVDGIVAGTALLPSASNPVGREAVFITGWLGKGVHSFALDVRNFANGIEFAIGRIAICVSGGPDAGGEPAWIASRRSRTGAAVSGRVHSKVSPFCLRGCAYAPPAIGMHGTNATARLFPCRGWWVDVPLDPNVDTVVAVDCENGFKSETVSIDWIPFIVPDESGATIRQDDALLLSSGEYDGTIIVDGEIVAEGGSTAVPYCFNSPGRHVVGFRHGEETREIEVYVVSCLLDESYAAWKGKTSSVVFRGDGFGRMNAVCDHGATLSSVSISKDVCNCSLNIPARENPRSIAFEIDNPDASVAGASSLSPFSAHYTLDGVYYVDGRLDDGTRIVVNRLAVFDLPSTVELRMKSRSGICFEDGSGIMSITSDDLDDTGSMEYKFFLPADVDHPCQFLHAYEKGREVAQ